MTFDCIGFMGRSKSGKDLAGNYLAENYGFVPVALADPLKRFCGKVFPFDPDTHLWGASKFRNIPVEVNWDTASESLYSSMNAWIEHLPLVGDNLRPRFRMNLFAWFGECRERADADGKLSARIALQLLGTEYGRNFQDSLWVDYFYLNIAKRIKAGGIYNKYYGIVGEVFAGPEHTAPPIVRNGIVITDLRFNNELELVRKQGGVAVRLIRVSQEGKESETDKVGIKQHQSEVELLSIPLDKFDVVLRMEEGIPQVEDTLDKMMEDEVWTL